MSLWSRFFGSSYDDERLESAAQTAVLEDPMIANPVQIKVESKDGVISLNGSVEKTLEKDHIEGAVRDALRYHGLKFERIANDIQVKTAAYAA